MNKFQVEARQPSGATSARQVILAYALDNVDRQLRQLASGATPER